jgi:Mlc titration factor MtfA (ptsG expression regulator)/Tfp pilus assembly protein PilF
MRHEPSLGKTELAVRDDIASAHSGSANFPRFAAEPRERRADEPFPETWLPYLRENVFLYRLLSEADQARLCEAVRWFIATKFWEGCAGLRITEEIQVTIAGQACLLVLGLDGYCFDELKTVLVYPGGYLGGEGEPADVGARPEHRLGEAHGRGPVVLSWWHVRWGGRNWRHPNVVLHEFAHKLAEQGDPYTGMPPFGDPLQAERWEKGMLAEYRRLRNDIDYERPTLLDPYGAASRAEFIAVASECFFLQPLALGQRHPALYQLLAECYRQDPAQWRVDAAAAEGARAADEEYVRHELVECSALLQYHPDAVEAYHQRADCWCRLGEFDNALADCTQILLLVGKVEKAGAYCERARIHDEAGSYNQAIADYSEAIRRAPDFARAYRDRGAAYAARGEHGKAIADLTRALQLDPNDDNALLWRAHVRCEARQYEKALRDLSRAIRLCPHRPDGHRKRGLVYLGRQEYDRAIADLSEAVRLDPSDAESYLARAEAFEGKGKMDEAERDRAAARRSPLPEDITTSTTFSSAGPVVRVCDERPRGAASQSPRTPAS